MIKQPHNQDISGQSMDDAVEALSKMVTSKDYFIDVGAHVGIIAHPVITKSKPKKSILIEPNPELRELLEENMQEVEADYIIVGNPAWDKVEEKEYLLALAQSSIIDRGQGDDRIMLVTTTLDNEIEKHFPTKGDIVLKIDVELGEPWVIKGLARNMNRVKYVLMELMPDHLEKEAKYPYRQFLAELIDMGFKIGVLGEDTQITKESTVRDFKIDIILYR